MLYDYEMRNLIQKLMLKEYNECQIVMIKQILYCSNTQKYYKQKMLIKILTFPFSFFYFLICVYN